MNVLEEALKEAGALLGDHAFGVKLEAPDGKTAVTQRHDDPSFVWLVAVGRGKELVGEGGFVDGPTVVTPDDRPRGQGANDGICRINIQEP